MTIKIDRSQRDAIYAQIRTDLSGAGDVFLSVEAGDFDAARRTRRRLEDDMRLLDDIGWEPETEHDEFELTMPAADLARTLRSLSRSAGAVLHTHIVEHADEREDAASLLLAQTTYGALLSQLVGEQGQG